MGDQYGNVVHIGERDCSVQRRQQKLLEEAPPPPSPLSCGSGSARPRCRGARRGLRQRRHLEFLVDRQDAVYFMEVNTRIQVEHPVTEAISGLDLVKTQLRVRREALPWRQEQIQAAGARHRVPHQRRGRHPRFLPHSGTVTRWVPPGGPGVRVDSHLYSGHEVPSHYDPLLAKVIAWGSDREAAWSRMKRALAECMIEGVATTVPSCASWTNRPTCASSSRRRSSRAGWPSKAPRRARHGASTPLQQGIGSGQGDGW